jgi:hypothetical protein
MYPFLRTLLYSDPLDFLGGGGTALENQPEPKTDEEKRAAAAKAASDKIAADAAKEEAEKKKNQTPPKKKDKDDQVGELRIQRDALAKENEELKKYREELEKLKGLKPVAEYVEKKFGKVDEDAVNKFIQANKERKGKLTELEKKYQEKELTVQELHILQSDLWRDEYAAPMQKADQDLFATVAMIDKEGKIRYPELFVKLKTNLLAVDKDGKPKNSVQIKQALKEFATEFKQVTQEDYEIPKLTDVTVAVEQAYNKYTAAVKAKQNWDKTVEEKQKEKLYDSTKKQERDNETIILQRGKVLDLVKNEFKYEELDGVFEEDEVKEEFDKVHGYVVKVMKGEEKQTEYPDFLQRMAKASMFNGLLEKYKELEEKFEKEIGKKHSSLGSGSAKRGKDDEGNQNRNVGKEPLDFLH